MLKTLDPANNQTFKDQNIIVIDSNITSDSTNVNDLDLAIDISHDTIVAYLQWKFPDREHHENEKLVNLLLTDLDHAGIKKCYQIEKTINDNLKWFSSFEKANPPSNSIDHRFSDIGVIMTILIKRLVP
ncbi:MAG: hypothetical protein ABSF65_06900 [Candidatus Bathyarchaeia archaeon]|jgi:hypothetical protein